MAACLNSEPTKNRDPGTGRFAKGHSGNPVGRPRGSKIKSPLLYENISEGDAATLVQRTKDLALKGDAWAHRFCMDELSSPSRGRLIRLPLPQIRSEREVVLAHKRIFKAVTSGIITLAEAKAFDDLVDRRRRDLHSVCRTPVSRYQAHGGAPTECEELTENFRGFDDDDYAARPTGTPAERMATAEPESGYVPKCPQEKAEERLGPSAVNTGRSEQIAGADHSAEKERTEIDGFRHQCLTSHAPLTPLTDMEDPTVGPDSTTTTGEGDTGPTTVEGEGKRTRAEACERIDTETPTPSGTCSSRGARVGEIVPSRQRTGAEPEPPERTETGEATVSARQVHGREADLKREKPHPDQPPSPPRPDRMSEEVARLWMPLGRLNGARLEPTFP